MATFEDLQKENEKLKLELQETKLFFKNFVDVHKQTCEELDKIKKKLKHAQYKRAIAMSKYCHESMIRMAGNIREDKSPEEVEGLEDHCTKQFMRDYKLSIRWYNLAQKFK